MAKLQEGTGAVVIGIREFQELMAKVGRAVTDSTDVYKLLDNIGQQQEDAAKRRIYETKRGPDGKRWAPWSESYAETRKGGQTLLRNKGHLGDSIDHVVDAPRAVEIGSNLEYANAHLFGVTYTRMRDRAEITIPARPFLDTDGGFADSSDRDEIRDFVREFLGGLLS